MVLFALYLSVHVAACTRDVPPANVIAAFKEKFPDAQDIDWEQEKNGTWEAEFGENKVGMSASFTAEGQWLETETTIHVTELPGAVQAALQGKEVKGAAQILHADGSMMYEAEVMHKEFLYDASGTLMSQQ